MSEVECFLKGLEPPRRRKDRRMPETSVRAVFSRSRGLCEALTEDCIGISQALHHRLMRSQGGGHEPANLLHCCEPCHRFIHSHPEMSYTQGWLIRNGGTP